jgi:hypothetical protein
VAGAPFEERVGGGGGGGYPPHASMVGFFLGILVAGTGVLASPLFLLGRVIAESRDAGLGAARAATGTRARETGTRSVRAA